MHDFSSYVAIGDSFTEGVGDELPDGRVRGWADLVALGLAAASSHPVSYANLAIRGRLVAPIVGEQLDAALRLRPALLSLNGGGNDVMRPRVAISSVADKLIAAVDRATAEGAHVLLASGANPSARMVLGSLIQSRGERLAQAIRDQLPRANVTFVDNWADAELAGARYWSPDRIHMNALGHARVAANVLAALDVPVPEHPGSVIEQGQLGRAAYWRRYMLPWIARRLRGRSSGDGRDPKIPTLEPVVLQSAERHTE
jgi:lysophospholipase L1-like esterase